MTPRQHGDTETKLAGFEARLQDGFEWANAHGREIIAGLAVLFVVGAIAAGIWEWRRHGQAEGNAELARIEARFTQAMGATSDDPLITEPANAEQAKKAREAALAELDAFIAERGLSSDQARIASLRAAEIEVDLGRLPDADKRLVALTQALDPSDARRGVALRLRGYVLDQSGDALAAAEVYEEGAKVKGYPPRALLFVKAGDAFAPASPSARSPRIARRCPVRPRSRSRKGSSRASGCNRRSSMRPPQPPPRLRLRLLISSILLNHGTLEGRAELPLACSPRSP
jgi:hypothetical protein